MPMKSGLKRGLKLASWSGVAAAAVFAGAAMAQPVVVDSLTVTGRYHLGPNVQDVSAAVDYSDLDLTTHWGRMVLKDRIRDTARDLCARLDEDNTTSSPAIASCERDAISSARESERLAVATAVPPTYAAAPDRAYVAPLGADTYGAPASAVVPDPDAY